MFHQSFLEFIGEMNKLSFDITKEFQPIDISEIEYTLLEYLYHFENRKLTDFMEMFSLSDPQTRRVLKKLKDKKFLVIDRDAVDFRKRIFEITREGKAKIDECYFQVSKGVQEKYSYLTEEEQKNIIECIRYIQKKILK